MKSYSWELNCFKETICIIPNSKIPHCVVSLKFAQHFLFRINIIINIVIYKTIYINYNFSSFYNHKCKYF